MNNHIIKYEHRDVKQLPVKETWCGYMPKQFDWLFHDAQHAVLNIEQVGSVIPCKECLKSIRDVIDMELGCAVSQQETKQ